MAEEKKKKKHTGRNVTIGVLAAAILGLFGWFNGGDGLGIGTGLGFNQPAPAQETGSPATPAETEPTHPGTEVGDPGEDELILTVRESTVLVNGEPVAAEDLESTLSKAYTDGVKVTLQDEGAIKATYDEVVSVLTQLDIPFEQ